MQYARPIADLLIEDWTTAAGGTTGLYAEIDEVSHDDGDYIKLPSMPYATGETYRCSLGTVTDPSSSTDHVVRVRIGGVSSVQGGGTWTLKSGGASIKSVYVQTDESGSVETFETTLSGSEADAIAHYEGLTWEFAGDGDAVRVYWVEFQVPAVAQEIRHDWSARYASDFSAGVDGWTAQRATLTGNVDGIGGENDALRSSSDGTTGAHGMYRAMTAGLTIEVRGRCYIPSSNGTGVRAAWYKSGNPDLIGTPVTTLDAWQWFTGTGTLSGTALTIALLQTSAGAVSFTASGQLLYLKDVVIGTVDTAGTQAIGSGEAFGSDATIGVTVEPSEIESGEGFETSSVYGTDPALEEAGDVGSEEGFETPALTELAAFVWVEDADGIGSLEGFETDGTIHAEGTAMPSEIGSSEAFGSDGTIGNGVPPRGDGAIAPVTGAAALLTDAQVAALAGVSETCVRCFTLGIPYHGLERELTAVADALGVDRQRARAGFARAKVARWARGRGNGSYGFLRASREDRLLRPVGIGSGEAFETPGAS